MGGRQVADQLCLRKTKERDSSCIPGLRAEDQMSYLQNARDGKRSECPGTAIVTSQGSGECDGFLVVVTSVRGAARQREGDGREGAVLAGSWNGMCQALNRSPAGHRGLARAIVGGGGSVLFCRGLSS